MQNVAVFYLARLVEGFDHFRAFADSYRAKLAGEAHDFYLIIKGTPKPGYLAAIEHIFRGIDYKTIHIPDEGYDIHAYIKAAHSVDHEHVCFFNTFTQLLSDNWLKKMWAQYRKPGVGAVGVTGSYESLRDSFELINKANWLMESRRARFSSQLVRQFEGAMGHHSRIPHSRYLRFRKFAGDLRHRRKSLFSPKLHAEFAQLWAKHNETGEAWHHLKDYDPFPNPHLRSSGFLVARSRMLKYKNLGPSKWDCCQFESGVTGLSRSLIDEGLELLVVGADGAGYPIDSWSTSRTFRLSHQENLLATDNRVSVFASLPTEERRMLARMTWGDYTGKLEPGLIDLGFPFSKRPSAPKPNSEKKISIVIPTHSRLELVKDAIETIRHQAYSNWELVVFDNCSSEPFSETIKGYNDPRIRYERSNDFLPVTDSWNRAIDYATGDYIMLIGDDDGVVPNFFAKINTLVAQFDQPDFIYSSLYQFMHPGVYPPVREGYVAELKNGFFFLNRNTPFLLSAEEAEHAWKSSMDVKRSFTFNMQAFTFSRNFLNSLRVDNKVFHSPFPDYYIANLAMARSQKILISPEPLGIAGVSTASFGYTLFNGLEKQGADLLNSKMSADPLFSKYAKKFLPGSLYQDNYILTMGHVAKNIPTTYSTETGIARYRRLQTYRFIESVKSLSWPFKSERGAFLWKRLSLTEKLWALLATVVCKWKPYSWLSRSVSETAFVPIQKRIATGDFARLPELYQALDEQERRPIRTTEVRVLTGQTLEPLLESDLSP